MKLSLDSTQDHPTQHTLLSLHAGELEGEEKKQVREHVSGCSTCSAFLQELESFKEQFASTHSREGILASVRQRADKDSVEVSSWWSRLFVAPHSLIWSASLVALLMLGLLFIYQNHGDDTDGSYTRIKGAEISLSYLVAENGKPVLAKPGRILHPRDRIQFRLTAPRGGYVHIVGVDEAGTVTVYFPLPGVAPELYPGGSARPVPGSIILDDTLGKERVFVLICAGPIPREALVQKVLSAASDPRQWISSQRLPLECQQRSILLHKDSSP